MLGPPMRDRFPRAKALTGLFAALFALGAAASAHADEPQRFLPPDLAPMAVLASIQPEGILQPPLVGGIFDVSPGHLAKAHESMDGSAISDCRKCHPTGGRRVANALCLAAGCHADDIGKHQANKLHFHGTDLVLKRTCGECHTDHQGVEFSMINDPNPKAKIAGQQTPASAWGTAMQRADGSKKTWDHDLTTYKLIGGHKIDCDKCHKPTDKRPKSSTRTFL